MEKPLVEMKNIVKTFGNVCALDGVDFSINKAEIIGLVGDNGAGKSTLIKIVSGVHSPDSGEIYIRGEKMNRWSVARAREAGIETVYQDRALVEQQTIARNIFMGREIKGFLGFTKVKEQFAEADRLMRGIGFTSEAFSSDSIVATLSGGEMQGVAIARALYFQSEIIILDEPTTALSLTESEKVFNFVRRIKERGSSCIFISHNIYHTYSVADRFVVLDRGKVVLETDKEHTTADQLIKDLQDIVRAGNRVSQASVLQQA